MELEDPPTPLLLLTDMFDHSQIHLARCFLQWMGEQVFPLEPLPFRTAPDAYLRNLLEETYYDYQRRNNDDSSEDDLYSWDLDSLNFND